MSEIVRSNRRDVRNPVLALPAMDQLEALPPEARAALAVLMRDIAKDARERAQQSWRRNKGPMAAYWKAVGAYAEHIRRAVRRSGISMSKEIL
jgi:hypothetical protein